jgi:hypothetical protein
VRTFVVAIKLGQVVDLDVVRDGFGEFSQPSWPVSVVFATLEFLEIVIFQLLL